MLGHLQNVTFAFKLSEPGVTVLLQAPWPSVATLVMGGARENHAAVIAGCMHKWPALKSLRLHCNLALGGVEHPFVFWEKEKFKVKQRWPSLQCTLML